VGCVPALKQPDNELVHLKPHHIHDLINRVFSFGEQHLRPLQPDLDQEWCGDWL